MHIEEGDSNSYSVDHPQVYSWGWLGDTVPNNKWSDDKFKNVILDKLKNNDKRCHSKRGIHGCEICGNGMGNAEIWISYDKKIYVCPSGVGHYIENHNYRPSDEVLNAVLLGRYIDGSEVHLDWNKEYEDIEKARKELIDNLANG